MTEHELLDSIDATFEAYLVDQHRFKGSFSWDDMRADIDSQIFDVMPEGGNHSRQAFLDDWCELLLTIEEQRAFESKGEAARQRARQERSGKRDPWLSVKKLTKGERGLMVRGRSPFRVLATRKTKPQHQQRTWERKAGEVWSLLIEGPWTGMRVLTMACNYYRDRQLTRLAPRSVMCLQEATSPKGFKYFELVPSSEDIDLTTRLEEMRK